MSNGFMLAVLVVEDSQFFADLTVRILKRSGFNVNSRIVSSRAALLESLKGGKWDIIISDNVMPNFSALGALEVRNEVQSEIPFVIVSEDISQKELNEAYGKGCKFYLPKDRITDLPKVIEQALKVQ